MGKTKASNATPIIPMLGGIPLEHIKANSIKNAKEEVHESTCPILVNPFS